MDTSAPGSHLRLEWVYGYRGHRCRSNVWYSTSKEIVFFAARVAIVLNPREHRQRFFFGHSDDIVCLCLHPQLILAASGQTGRNGYICIWDTCTMEPVAVLKNKHPNGVSSVAFSSSGSLLASVGEDSFILIWDWSIALVVASIRGHSERIFDIAFNPFIESQLVSCGVKHIKFWCLFGNTLISECGQFGRTAPIQTILCATFASSSVTVTGTLSGDIYVWSDAKILNIISNAHRDGITSIHKWINGFITGGKDGVIRTWTLELNPGQKFDLERIVDGYKGLCVRSVRYHDGFILVGTRRGEILELASHSGDSRWVIRGHGLGYLRALDVHPRSSLFATADDDGIVRLWNFDLKKLILGCSVDGSCRCCCFSPDGFHLALGLNDGCLLILSTHNLSLVVRKHDRNDAVNDLKFSPNGVYLAAGFSNNLLDVHHVFKGYNRVSQCFGSQSFITHLDWSIDSLYIRINNGVGERLIFRAPDGMQVLNVSERENIEWSSWTCIDWPEVEGIWPKYSDSTNVNAVQGNAENGLVVTGDELGLLKLFRFPALRRGAKFLQFEGHSTHVTNVRFTFNKNRVLSIGGLDRAIFQWKLLPGTPDFRPAVDKYLEPPGDSDSESSLDSDVEFERQMNYERPEEKKKTRIIRDRRSFYPVDGLKMKCIFGYRSFDCSNNVVYSANGCVVYHVASVGVVLERESRSQRFYTHHTDSILCLTLHPFEDLIATGQAGICASIHVWQINTTRTLSVLRGHRVGVASIDFSSDGIKLASVGLDSDHCIIIWDWKKGVLLSSTKGHPEKIFMIKWNPFDAIKLVSVGIKHVKFWQQTAGDLLSRRGIFGGDRLETLLCVVYGKSLDTCLAGGLNGLIYVWKDNLLTRTIQAHNGPVFCMQSLEQGFVSGGKDGTVCLWDEYVERCLITYTVTNSHVSPGSPGNLIEDNPPIRSCMLGHAKILVGTRNGDVLEVDKEGLIRVLIQGHEERSINGLSTHPTRNWFATVGYDKTLRVWDFASLHVVVARRLDFPAECVAFSSEGRNLAVGFVNGSVSIFNQDGSHTTSHFHHRKLLISDVKFSNDSKYLAVASLESYVDIYNVHTNARIAICDVAIDPSLKISIRVDWEISGKLLQVHQSSGERSFFDIPDGKLKTVDSGCLAELHWASYTHASLTETDSCDVNAIDLSHSRSLYAVGDNLGCVKLLNFPYEDKLARSRKYRGHGAGVTNVRWSYNDRHLISSGDGAVIVWQRSGEDEKAERSALQGDSEDSDTDDEEDGYDSDVELEKKLKFKGKMCVKDNARGSKLRHDEEESIEINETHAMLGLTHSRMDKPIIKRANDNCAQDLILDRIHGYRGFDCRNNVYYLDGGNEIVYHAAGVGVVLNLVTGRQSFYMAHTDDIVCLCVNGGPRDRNVVATGQLGVEPSIHVWHAPQMITLSILRVNHSAGIGWLDFSASGKFLLSVGCDDDHTISVWKWHQGVKVASAKGGNRRVLMAQFYPDSDTEFMSIGVKHVKLWRVVGCDLINLRCFIDSVHKCRLSTMLSLAFGSKKTAFTGSAKGNVLVWQGHVLDRIVLAAHSGPIFAMHSCTFDRLILSGAKESDDRNACVKLWDPEMKRCKPFSLSGSIPQIIVRSVNRQQGKILVGTNDNSLFEIDEKTGSVQLLQQNHNKICIRALGVHPEKDIYATAGDDCSLRIWDLESKRMLVKLSLPDAGCSIDYSPRGDKMVAGLTNGEFLLFTTSDLQVRARRRDRGAAITNIRFSPDGHFLAVGLESGQVDVYDVFISDLQRVFYSIGSASAVTSLDFSPNSSLLLISFASSESHAFSLPHGNRADLPVSGEMDWSTWTNPFSFDSRGVWPKEFVDGLAVNSVDVNHECNLVATADEFGFIKLFNFPCTKKFAKYKKYIGHSSHVTRVKFTHDDRFLISVGGHDACIFVWRIN